MAKLLDTDVYYQQHLTVTLAVDDHTKIYALIVDNVVDQSSIKFITTIDNKDYQLIYVKDISIVNDNCFNISYFNNLHDVSSFNTIEDLLSITEDNLYLASETSVITCKGAFIPFTFHLISVADNSRLISKNGIIVEHDNLNGKVILYHCKFDSYDKFNTYLVQMDDINLSYINKTDVRKNIGV